MNIVEIKKKCFGCACCVDICPVNALEMNRDENGFYTPMLRREKCIDCGKCVKICPAINNTKKSTDPDYYYGWHMDAAVRESSSSGGIFRAFADHITEQGGVVFGAKYCSDFRVVKMASTAETSVEDLQKSKYVQSDATGMYRSIKERLNEGKMVMVSGTPCQIAAVKNICGDHEKLVLVDFLCGGVPSPECYTQYIQWLEKRYHSKVTSVDFRNKKNGWTRCAIRVNFENGKTYFSRYEYDPYYAMFYLTPYMKNEACLDCKFAIDRYADITIADFWGFRKLNIPNDEKGMSLIVAHTELGKAFLNQIDQIKTFHLSEEQGNYGFSPKKNSKEKREKREAFLSDFRKNGFIKAAHNSFFKNGRVGVVLRKIKGRIKGLIK